VQAWECFFQKPSQESLPIPYFYRQKVYYSTS